MMYDATVALSVQLHSLLISTGTCRLYTYTFINIYYMYRLARL